jgi:hypothetical protein
MTCVQNLMLAVENSISWHRHSKLASINL